jgi:transcriptional regulator NrdR family protein
MATLKVRKRDLSIESFSFKKLHRSIVFAFRHAEVRDHDSASAVAHEVRTKLLSGRKKIISTDEIESVVTKVLRKHRQPQVIKFYRLTFLRTRKPKIASVMKISGTVEKFDSEKVFKSVCKAFRMAHEPVDHRCQTITKKAMESLEKKRKKTLSTEEIREAIVKILEKEKLFGVSRAYLLHRYL